MKRYVTAQFHTFDNTLKTKKNWNPYNRQISNCWNLELRYRNIIRDWEMCNSNNEKRNKEATEGIEVLNQENLGIQGKKKLQIPGNIESGYYLSNRVKEKVWMEYIRWIRKLLETKHLGRNLGSLSYKMFWTLLKLNKKREIWTIEHGIWDVLVRLYVTRKKKEKKVLAAVRLA